MVEDPRQLTELLQRNGNDVTNPAQETEDLGVFSIGFSLPLPLSHDTSVHQFRQLLLP